jgi:hypothetical protein
MFQMLRLFVVTLLLASLPLNAQDYVPDELQGWQQWVLKDKAYRNCPFVFDRTSAARSFFLCAWPDRLQLEVSAAGARFSQQWTLHEEAQWVALPGSAEHWPDQVEANGRAVEVIARKGVPSVLLAPGTWRLAGRFVWDERPAVLQIPAESGLLSLTVDGRAIARPELEGDRVFLGERVTDSRESDSVRADVYRLVADGVPTRLVTRLQLEVSGGVREESFGPLLPEGFVPLWLNSPIPAKFEADGTLLLQVRPGSWEIELAARGPEALDAVQTPAVGRNLPASEIWSYRANDRLRVSAVEGLPPVDPLQSGVPRQWASLPAFRVEAEALFTITERSRGVVSPSNDLQLERTLWLDFDGSGYTVKDEITGAMRTDWRLDMARPYTLLAATEHGDDLLITRGREAGWTGIEVRVPEVDIEALGRGDTRAAMPVTGWDARFASVGASLNLPPGHKLLVAPGVDRAVGSWMDRWELLDFFLVLIITIATWRLRLVRSYQMLSAALLVVALIPFIANQVRVAIYPQLEPQYEPAGLFTVPYDYRAAPPKPAGKAADELQRALVSGVAPPTAEPLEEAVVVSQRVQSRSLSRFAPNALVQAGPGVPSWRWNTYRLTWSGPVDTDQAMRLVILPRWLVSALRFLLIGLVLSFAAILAAEIAQRRWTLPGGLSLGRDAAGAIATLVLGSLLLAASPSAEAEIPDQELLRQLEDRLLEPPDCVPRCAEIAAANVIVDSASISMELSIHALQPVAIPLPGSQEGWRPTAVLVDGNGDVRVRRAPDGMLWIYVAPGRHGLTLRGPVPAVDSLEVPFPTPPRVVAAESDAWLVAGIKDRRLLSGSLQMTRLQAGGGGEVVRWESSRFPAFVRVTRQLAMDLDWTVETVIERVAPVEGALTLDLPLLDGESIVSGNFEVRDGRVLVSMQPQEQQIRWTSTLALQSPLTLQAPESAAWSETWAIAVGSIWNVAFDGVPESNVDRSGDRVRFAVFDPRAGESLVMTATRPEASEGGTLAFDAVKLEVTYGSRSSDVDMTLAYRSTRGAQHVIRLPDEAEVTSVAIDGDEQTLRPEDGKLTLPIQPGEHQVSVAWRSPGGMGLRSATPSVDLGAPASNIDLTVFRAENRWLLATSGPDLGPAVLYWTELVVLLLAAGILGRIGLSPLQTRHWLILGLGFSTFSWGALAVVALWLLVCGARERLGVDMLTGWRFNVAQVIIAGFTVLALLAIVVALPFGLLGSPDMHVIGNGSYENLLSWFADRSASELPLAAAFTVPMWIYKAVILAWALWLSFALVRWMPWVWKCFSGDGLWRSEAKA